MDILENERVDHHGIVAGIIHDLGIIKKIDALCGTHADEKISTGEAVAGMIINGLGFTDRPITLTPQFFENCPMELLFRAGVEAEDFNRFKLGRALDSVFEFRCTELFARVAKEVCESQGIDCRFGHLDTTTFSVTGEHYEDSDEHVIHMKHGYSKDHRPDLRQAVLELLVSQEGGVPLMCKGWDGNTSDDEIFKKRTAALVHGLKQGGSPKYLIADSKLYNRENAINLKEIPFITRIPETNNEVNRVIEESC